MSEKGLVTRFVFLAFFFFLFSLLLVSGATASPSSGSSHLAVPPPLAPNSSCDCKQQVLGSSAPSESCHLTSTPQPDVSHTGSAANNDSASSGSESFFSLSGLASAVWEKLEKSLHNDFIGGSLVLTISGFFAALIYKVTNDVTQAVTNKIYLTVEIHKGSEPYYWLTTYLVRHKIVQRSSRFSVVLDSSFTLSRRRTHPHHRGPGVPLTDISQMPKVSLLPVGTKTTYKHLYKQRDLVWITVEGEGNLNIAGGMFLGGPGGASGVPGYGGKDSGDKAYTLQVVNFDKRGEERIQQLLKDAHQEYVSSTNDTVEMYVARHGNWERVGAKHRRMLKSVILDEGHSERILRDAAEFLADQEWYTSRGIPYRRGYLLSGPPGVGKTSMIFSLAGELSLAVCMIPLNGPDMDGYSLSRLLNTAPENGIIVLEDIDAAFTTREEAEVVGNNNNNGEDVNNNNGNSSNGMGGNLRRGGGLVNPRMGGKFFPQTNRMGNGLSLSDLLNGIDGITGQEGRLLFMTTNHPEKLDPALVRPGRVDLHAKFKLATKAQVEQMFLKFFSTEEDVETLAKKFADLIEAGKHSMAQIQGYLMNFRRNPRDAVEKFVPFEASA